MPEINILYLISYIMNFFQNMFFEKKHVFLPKMASVTLHIHIHIKNSPLRLFFRYIQTYFRGYFFFRVTALVSTKCISKN